MILLCVRLRRDSTISLIVYPIDPHCLIRTNHQPHIFHKNPHSSLLQARKEQEYRKNHESGILAD